MYIHNTLLNKIVSKLEKSENTSNFYEYANGGKLIKVIYVEKYIEVSYIDFDKDLFSCLYLCPYKDNLNKVNSFEMEVGGFSFDLNPEYDLFKLNQNISNIFKIIFKELKLA